MVESNNRNTINTEDNTEERTKKISKNIKMKK